MFGLVTPCSITRRTQTGQGTDGAPIYSTATVWTGRCFANKKSGTGKWEATGLIEVGAYDVYLPYLTGTSRPQPAYRIVIGAESYTVEFVPPLSEGIHRHHLEIACRMTVT